ncbi:MULTISPECIES: hypothetical protein [unclassified Leucobacter]|uniref:hypothetical protein n=1 Tax=unclassified Leucobacter TaxID=2621730 RepID=UPI00301AADD4
MVTFSDPSADAAEAAEAVRGIAHALHATDHPRDVYDVIGELLSLTRRLTNVTGQLAGNIAHHQRLAADNTGNRQAGADAAQSAIDGLREASAIFDQAETAMDRASQAASRIAWQDLPDTVPPRRFVNIVFLQGEEADRIIETINRHGPDGAFEELAGYDFGDETVDAALENGYVYDRPPTGQLDRVATHDVYTMVYNPFMGHVGLYREHDALPDPVLLGIEDPPAHAAPTTTASVAAVRESSRADRLGTPRVSRASYPTRSSLRGLGA